MPGYGAVSRRKVKFAPGFRHPSDDCTTLSVNPAVKGYLFRIRERVGSERKNESDGFSLSSAVPKIQWISNIPAPSPYHAYTAIRVWDTFFLDTR